MSRSKAITAGQQKTVRDRAPDHGLNTSTSRKSARRKTGIRVLGDMNWGTHICVFYDTMQDLLETVVPYFHAGLDRNEFCMWAVSGPITEDEARSALRSAIPEFDMRLSAGQFELLNGREWYLNREQFELDRIIDGWNRKLGEALDKGFDGLRLSGNAFWNSSNYWIEFDAYEQELHRTLAGKKMIALCTYSLGESRASDILDVAHSHQCSVARRNGDWEFLESPALKQAKQEMRRLRDALDVLSRPFPGYDALTERERIVLAQIVRGASSKEAARSVGVSPRTIEFHRANIMKKLDAKNPADLVRKVLHGA
jgi:DNA-binding CsgD family transcriptional regulator